MIEYTNGDAIRFLITFKNENGALFDPSSTWGKVYDSSSTVVASVTGLTRVETGSYTHDWQSDPASVALGVGAFEAYGLSGSLTYRRREKLFQLV